MVRKKFTDKVRLDKSITRIHDLPPSSCFRC